MLLKFVLNGDPVDVALRTADRLLVDPALAQAAVDRIVVQYEVLPAARSLDEALAPGAPLVHDDAAGNVAHHFNFERGDVDAGFRASDVTVEGTWESTRQWHTALETIGCVSSWQSGRVTMWCNTQTPFLARGRYATALGVPGAQVRVIQTEVGGGFGGKSGDDNASAICALLAQRSGRPAYPGAQRALGRGRARGRCCGTGSAMYKRNMAVEFAFRTLREAAQRVA
jgi:CO/xanthine dehydrogenase Mo-binding subunit